ncbi:MAG: Uroporphyrinogen-III C-methyltransferase [Syntrophorhabdaceae bacterium PtaU1.Bin034]|nr:MAG: Uroporphyrinogen-III C-methyltransferase [Syntrophorhabdaceae bacterium PtaU1.Bin034]
MEHGKVYLVGAGPGDIGLFTLKGLRCLQKADVIVYDFHINPQILNYAKHDAEFVYAGKRGGHHEMDQDRINALLADYARKGKLVCRLKGGDPFVFGRGGEEAEYLSRAAIPFEIVPGVSSVVAAPAYAGIPLTHRDYASSFAVVTGTQAAAKLENSTYWSCLATTYDTLVFLMGVKNIEIITTKLIEHGKPADTAAALIRWGTRPEQRTVIASLGDIAEIARNGEIRPPAILIVGKVVGLRNSLKWYEEKPLFGHRILITRQRGEEFEPLEDLGAEVFEFPTLRIAPPYSYDDLDRSIEQLHEYNWVVITSSNAFEHFVRRLVEKGRDIRDLKGVRICAIGSRTAETIGRFGIKVDLIPDEFNAEGLVKSLMHFAGQREDLTGVRILMPRAEKGRDLFPRKVREFGGIIDIPVAYRSARPKKHAKRLRRLLSEGRISLATFTSGATFNNFMDMLGPDAKTFLDGVAIAVIGPVTKKVVEKADLKADIMPSKATIAAMVEEIIKWASTGRIDKEPGTIH